MEAVPADARKLRQENREMREELKELRAVRKALSLYYYDAPRADQERFRAGLGPIIKDLRARGEKLLEADEHGSSPKV